MHPGELPREVADDLEVVLGGVRLFEEGELLGTVGELGELGTPQLAVELLEVVDLVSPKVVEEAIGSPQGQHQVQPVGLAREQL
jgi:hypothetical protein